MSLADLGYLERSVAEKDKTLLVGCADGRFNEEVEARVETLKAQLAEKLAAAKEFEAQRLEQRITKVRLRVRVRVGVRVRVTPTSTRTRTLTRTLTRA